MYTFLSGSTHSLIHCSIITGSTLKCHVHYISHFFSFTRKYMYFTEKAISTMIPFACTQDTQALTYLQKLQAGDSKLKTSPCFITVLNGLHQAHNTISVPCNEQFHAHVYCRKVKIYKGNHTGIFMSQNGNLSFLSLARYNCPMYWHRHADRCFVTPHPKLGTSARQRNPPTLIGLNAGILEKK